MLKKQSLVPILILAALFLSTLSIAGMRHPKGEMEHTGCPLLNLTGNDCLNQANPVSSYLHHLNILKTLSQTTLFQTLLIFLVPLLFFLFALKFFSLNLLRRGQVLALINSPSPTIYFSKQKFDNWLKLHTTSPTSF